MRKIEDIIINDRPYGLYNIEGKEHEGLNGEPVTWWVYYADLKEGEIPDIDSKNWEPYSKGLRRRLFDISFVEYNISKEKWGYTNFRSGLKCEIKCNNKLIYSFGTFDMSFAFAKAQYLITMMSEHPFDFFNPKEENGRKIWWMGLPATIETSTYNPWEIRIIPDYSTGIEKETWWKEFRHRRANLGEIPDPNDIDIWDEDDYEKETDRINWGDALSDKYIDWFRKETKQQEPTPDSSIKQSL